MIPLVYDQLNEGGIDGKFILSLLQKIQVKHLADLGCGTGRLTIHFEEAIKSITAIDPNEEAIEYAKQNKYAENITWIVGDSSNLQANHYDAVTMTANVSQVFLTDESFAGVIEDVYKALKQGGHFIFDARNPLAKVWENWECDKTPDYAKHPINGEGLEIWTDYDGFIDDVYTFYETVKYSRTGEIIIKQKMQLKFRTEQEIKHALQSAGFTKIQVYSDWTFEEASDETKSFIFHCIK